MAKRRLKEEICLNCGFVFKEEDNFCPECGQENDHKIKSIFHFFRNFFSELLSLDSQVFRSIIPFLFRPGRLTLAYIQGKRKRYVAPIRLYLVMSFFYFFIFTVSINENVDSTGNRDSNKATSLKSPELPKNSDISQLNDSLNLNMDLDSTIQSTVDSALAEANEAIEKSNQGNKNSAGHWQNRRMGDQNIRIFNVKMKELDSLYNDAKLSEEEILVELKKENTFFNRLLIHRLIRMLDASPKDILEKYLDEIPLMMFFLIPFFALILKLLYFRKHYVAHLIFTLNIHSFIFLVFGLFFLINNFIDINQWVLIVTLLLVPFYIYKSFRNVYHQSRFMTLVKLFSFFIAYTVVLSFGLIFALIVSFLLL